MKTRILARFAALFILTWAISSCRKSENPSPVLYPPAIVIYDPDEGSTIQGPVEISADIVDPDPGVIVSDVSAKITRDSDNAVVFEEGSILNNSNFYSYHHIFTPIGLAGPAAMTLVIKAKGSGQTASRSVKFTVKP